MSGESTLNLYQGFNRFIGDFAVTTLKLEKNYISEIAKGIRSYNIKAGLFNLCTIQAILHIALGILGFTNPVNALLYVTASLIGRVFIEGAMQRTVVGSISGVFTTTQFELFKPFIM